jgi:hypothetical protein
MRLSPRQETGLGLHMGSFQTRSVQAWPERPTSG